MLIRMTKVIEEVGQGVAGGQLVELQAIAKQNGDNAGYCIANEYICGRIGQLIGLPVPPFGFMNLVGGTPADVMFASLNFNFNSGQLPPLTLAQCQNMESRLKSGIILFDIYIANSDRHRENLSVEAANPDNVAVFDHSGALLGTVAGDGSQRLIDMVNHMGITGLGPAVGHVHCLLRHLTTAGFLQEWVDRIKGIPDYFIDDICQEVVGMGVTQEEADATKEFLKTRRTTIVGIVNENRNQFHSITQPGLLI